MEHRNLGRSGLRVSRIGLGTIPFGSALTAADADRVLGAFVDRGGNFVDTANLYGGGRYGSNSKMAGRSETTVGRLIKARRKDLVIATKGFWMMDDAASPNGVGLSRTYLMREIDASLKRLGVEWIDLYQCHAFDFDTPMEETLKVLDEAVAAGKIRYVGVSNWDGWQVVKATHLARESGWISPISNQVWYNLLDRTVEHSVVPAGKDQGVAVISWGSTANGFLAGRYPRGSSKPSTGRFTLTRDAESSSWERLATDRNWRIVELVEGLARDLGVAPASIAIAWLLTEGDADVALVGGSTLSQYENQFRAAELPDRAGLLSGLTTISAPTQPYPRNFLETFARRGGPDFGGLR